MPSKYDVRTAAVSAIAIRVKVFPALKSALPRLSRRLVKLMWGIFFAVAIFEAQSLVQGSSSRSRSFAVAKVKPLKS
jgi:hypothetical protein